MRSPSAMDQTRQSLPIPKKTFSKMLSNIRNTVRKKTGLCGENPQTGGGGLTQTPFLMSDPIHIYHPKIVIFWWRPKMFLKDKPNFFFITGVSATWEFFPHNPVFSDRVPNTDNREARNTTWYFPDRRPEEQPLGGRLLCQPQPQLCFSPCVIKALSKFL